MPVIFTKDISAVAFTVPANTLIVTHERYERPNINGHHISWLRFRETYSEYAPDHLVLVGLNRMITPQNRCDMVNDYMQTLTSNIPKTVIDTEPFVGEPWRLWYHYSVAFGAWLGYTYSYPVEGDWLKWFYRESNECKLSAEVLPLYIRDTETSLPRLEWRMRIVEATDDDRDWYAAARKHTFEKHDTPKMIITSLLKLSNQRFGLDVSFDTFREQKSDINMPDLKIYQFLIEENRRRMEIYNRFTK